MRLTYGPAVMTVHTFNKVILFTIQGYLEQHKEQAELPGLLHRLNGQIGMYKQLNLFSQEEATIVLKASSQDEITEITKKNVSFIVFVLQLIKRWVEEIPKKQRPHLNISDKKLRLGKAIFFKDMIQLKKTNGYQYKLKKEIIDTSIETADDFFNYYKDKHVDK